MAFDFTDYNLWSDEEWINYDNEHETMRTKLKTLAPHFGLVHNKKTDNYFMTLSRNLTNLETDWKVALERIGYEWIGEAFCGALLVYFKIII